MMNDKVFIVDHADDEGQELCGVYSTYDKALAKAKALAETELGSLDDVYSTKVSISGDQVYVQLLADDHPVEAWIVSEVEVE